MEGYSRMDEMCPQLLDLIPKERELLVKTESSRNHRSLSEEKKLELRLGPPGVEDWTHTNNWMNNRNNNGGNSCKSNNHVSSSFLTQSMTVLEKESSQLCSSKPSPTPPAAVEDKKKKPFSPPSVNTAVPTTTTTTNTSQKRTAPAPVVGWPPIGSFRKNLANNIAKQASESQNVVPNKAPIEKPVEISRKGLFVKINMDGVPIGRKVDLKAYDSYDKLSTVVDELFRGLLAAQNDDYAPGTLNNRMKEKAITGLLDGSGEYTLVYEDSEGDRMLAGDVPWQMFVSTVKRLRVLKSSELSKLCCKRRPDSVAD